MTNEYVNAFHKALKLVKNKLFDPTISCDKYIHVIEFVNALQLVFFFFRYTSGAVIDVRSPCEYVKSHVT